MTIKLADFYEKRLEAQCPKCGDWVPIILDFERIRCRGCGTHWNYGKDDKGQWELFPNTIKTEEELEQWRHRETK